jgi:alpha-L-rhamnosidase
MVRTTAVVTMQSLTGRVSCTLSFSIDYPQSLCISPSPAHNAFSQQTNARGVLFDVIPRAEQQGVLREVMGIDPGMTSSGGILSSSYYFRFYLARALDHAGMADQYLASLKPWRDLLPLHFSTWPETPGKTRSDSHVWSAHPAYDLLTLVAGIEPASPGFASVRIAPHLGDLREVSAEFPHPQGMIKVHFERSGNALTGTVTLPAGLAGVLAWAGKNKHCVQVSTGSVRRNRQGHPVK